MSLIRFRLGPFFAGAWLIAAAAASGCASSTVLQSQPPGARVFLNGVPVGNTPYTMTDTNIVGTTTQIRLEYPGYQPFNAMIARSEQLDPVALIVGIIIWPVLLWVMGYQPMHVFVMQPGGPPPADNNGWTQPPPSGYPPPPSGYPPPPAGYPPPPPPGYPPPAGYPPPQ
jgi:hypothetical protein